jgi:TPR repeat protein
MRYALKPAMTAFGLGLCLLAGQGLLTRQVWADGGAPPAAAPVVAPVPDAKNPPPEIKDLMARAEKGEAQAQADLAGQYMLGRTLPEDAAQAAHWYRKAAVQGHAGSQYSLANLLYMGAPGVKKDVHEACGLFAKAAVQDMLAAEFYTGLCETDGLGGKKDHADAYFWLLAAQKKGWSVSRVLLDKASQDLTPEQQAEAKKRANHWLQLHPRPD